MIGGRGREYERGVEKEEVVEGEREAGGLTKISCSGWARGGQGGGGRDWWSVLPSTVVSMTNFLSRS